MLRWGEKISIFSGNANRHLAESIAKEMNIKLGDIDISRFPDGEVFVKFRSNIRGADVFLIQPTCSPPNETIMELLIMLDAAKRASAARVTAVIPFFGYARQDRKDQPRVPITAKLIANLITAAGASRILAMDFHSQQIQGFFDIPVDHLYAMPVLVPYLRSVLGSGAVVVSPDSGSVKLAQSFSDMLDAGLAVVAKRRIDASSVESSHLVGDVQGRVCLITDDLTTTAGTLTAAAALLKREGASKIYASVSHCLLTDVGRKRISESQIDQLVTTDAVPIGDLCNGKIKVISVAKLLGEAIQRIHEGASVSSLFDVKNHKD
ncbi:MAG TPA: ribose-phosphate pyrophosphokinase [Victivallales bacterium]|nr:ribose-phosphate pyrophosphokinase [Victivallales bacterium]